MEQLKPFAGTQFDIVVTVDPEAQAFISPLEDTLKAAGWFQVDWKSGAPIADINISRKGRPVLGVVSVSGVILQMHPEQIPIVAGAAQALVAALTTEGIETKAEPGVGVPNVNTRAVHILIGKKPL